MQALMELHVSCNHVWVLCSPYLTPQWRGTGLGCHASIPVSLVGLYGLEGQSFQELSSLFWGQNWMSHQGSEQSSLARPEGSMAL